MIAFTRWPCFAYITDQHLPNQRRRSGPSKCYQQFLGGHWIYWAGLVGYTDLPKLHPR